MPEKEIFIGRKEEIQLFREHFEKQFLPKKSFLEKIKTKNTEKTNEFAKIFFLYGDAGFGKSTLANEMTSEAKLISKGKEEELKIIKLDWDSLGRIDSFRQALDFIYAELIKDKYKIRKYFEDYGEALDKIRDIQKKIESKQENSDWTNNIGEISAKGIQVAAGYIPTFGDTAQKVLETKAVENLTKVTINYAVGAGAEKYQEWVRKNNILKPDEYLLWKNSEAQLAGILADGLKEASKENIILFGIDTYEIIDHFDEDFRNSFLKKILEEDQNRITIILSGRKDLSIKYKESFLKNLALISMETLLFQEEQVSEFASKEEIQFTEAEIKELVTHTRGIPLVVKEILSNIKTQAIPKDKLFADLRERSNGDQDILYGAVNGFIKYCNPEEKKKVFSLAILKEWDLELLQRLWGKEVNVELTLSDLAERHSFINRSKNGRSKILYEYLRKYLISELDESKSSIIRTLIQDYGKQISIYWEEKLRNYETKEPAIDDRYNDKNHITFLMNYLNAIAFMDIHKLFSILPGIILESMQFNLDVCKDIVISLEEFAPIMTSKQIGIYKTIKEGIDKFKFIDSENWKEQTPKEVFKLIDYFERSRNNLNDIQKTILEFRHGEIIFRNEDYEKAFEHLNLYESKFKYLIKIRTYLCDQYTNFGSRADNTVTIPACTKAIEYDPNNAKAYYERAIAYSYSSLQNLENFVTDFKKALEIEPKNSVFYRTRGISYYMGFKDNDNGLKDLTTSIDLNPDWFTYFHRAILYRILKEYDKAISDFDKHLELKPDSKAGYSQRGRTYRKIEKYEQALEDFNKILHIDSNFSSAYYGCGKVYFKMGNYEIALEEYNKALTLDEKNPRLLSSISQVLFILNREQAAIDALNTSFSLIREGRINWRVILLVNWFCTYAHIPEKREDAKVNLLELTAKDDLYDGKDDRPKGFSDEDRYLFPNVEKSIRDGHPDPELLKEFADKIADILG